MPQAIPVITAVATVGAAAYSVSEQRKGTRARQEISKTTSFKSCQSKKDAI